MFRLKILWYSLFLGKCFIKSLMNRLPIFVFTFGLYVRLKRITMCINNNRLSFHLWGNINLVRHRKVSKLSSRSFIVNKAVARCWSCSFYTRHWVRHSTLNGQFGFDLQLHLPLLLSYFLLRTLDLCCLVMFPTFLVQQ